MIKIKKRSLVFALIGTALAALLAGGACFFAYTQYSGLKLIKADDFARLEDMNESLGKLYSLKSRIDESFLWEIDEEEQMDALYRTLVDSLNDKYSSYMNPEEYDKWVKYVTGIFYGVGIQYGEDEDGNFLVVRVIEGGPADIAGLKEGDILLKVDGRSCSTADEFKNALQGEQGSRVKVTVKRDGKVRTFSILRGEVHESSVFSGTIDDKYGYIRITSFESNTAEQFQTELAEFENRNIRGLVIDIRNNLGGIMNQSVEIADMLLPECTIIHTEDKNGKKEYFNSDENCTKLPYVLLVNGHSASASEILAVAVKENSGGSLVGTKTYGKGIIQSLIELNDGSAISLTTAQYLSPKGNEIHKVGVKPDYEVKLSEKSKTDTQLEKAIELLQEGQGK